MLQINIDLREAEREIAALKNERPGTWRKYKKQAHKDISIVVRDQAEIFCPISPTKTQYVKTLKGGVTKRNDFFPGSLERSLRADHKYDRARIYINNNETAARGKTVGSYSNKIHNERGRSWRKLGVGSSRKNSGLGGGGVGDKFIPRAIKAKHKSILGIYENAIKQFKKKIEG